MYAGILMIFIKSFDFFLFNSVIYRSLFFIDTFFKGNVVNMIGFLNTGEVKVAQGSKLEVVSTCLHSIKFLYLIMIPNLNRFQNE